MTEAIRNTINPLYCGSEVKKFTGDSGVITSPGHPDNYTNNQDCHYLIEVAEGLRVELNVTKLDTEAFIDVLNVYDGDSNLTDTNLVGLFTGNMSTTPLHRIVSTSNHLYMVFNSDGSLVRSGWQMQYRSVNTSGK